jgi:pimeloyl-ACP methyl ester carboxylesterase
MPAMNAVPTAPPARVPLLLLPGLLGDREAWAAVIARLPAELDIRVPAAGAGISLAATAERVLDGAPPVFALAGHSMGGRIAVEIVHRAPQRVARLALLDTGYRPLAPGDAGAAERAGRMALLELARTEGMRAMARVWVRPMVAPERLADDALIEAIVAMFARRTPEDFAGQIEAILGRRDATDVLRAIACPTLVLCGADDRWSTPAQHEEIARLVVGSRLTIVPECGHMAPMERTDAVAAALCDWLASDADSPSARAA